MSRCININRGPVEAIVRDYVFRQPYILNLFLTSWFNLPINRFKEIVGVIKGYFIQLKDLRPAIRNKNWREVYRIIAVTVNNAVILYRMIKRVRDAYKNLELLQTGLFKVYVDPHIPLGFYVAIGQLLRKPITLFVQKKYIKYTYTIPFYYYEEITSDSGDKIKKLGRFESLLLKRIRTNQIYGVDYTFDRQENTRNIANKAKRKVLDVLKEAGKKFIIDEIKKEIRYRLGEDEPINEIEDLRRLFLAMNGIKQPLGLLVYGVSNFIQIKNAGSENEIRILQAAKQALSDMAGLASISCIYRYWEFLRRMPMYAGYTEYPDSGESGREHVDPLRYLDNTEVSPDNKRYKPFINLIVPLNINILTGVTSENEYIMGQYPIFSRKLAIDDEIITYDKYDKEMNEYGTALDDQRLQDESTDSIYFYEIKKEYGGEYTDIKQDILRGYKKSFDTIYISEESNISTYDYNKAQKLKHSILSSLAIPIGEHSFDLNRIRAILNSDGNVLNVASSLKINDNEEQGGTIAEGARNIRKLIEPMVYFVAKSAGLTRNFLSTTDLSGGDMVMVSLEPFSVFVPELPAVYCWEWYKEIYNASFQEMMESSVFNPEICIYRDLLPIKYFSLKYDDIDTENIEMYGRRMEVPSKWEAFIPKINIEIIDTVERHIYNYFNEYRKRVFIRGTVRPPLDISFVMDIVRVRADFSVQDFISLIVVPSSITLAGIDYDSESTYTKEVPAVELEFSTIGFINYTDVKSSTTTSAGGGMIQINVTKSEGAIDFSTGYYMLPSYTIKGNINPSKPGDWKKIVRLASDVSLLRWYALYNSLPITAEYGTIGADAEALRSLSVSIKRRPLRYDSDNNAPPEYYTFNEIKMPKTYYTSMFLVTEQSGNSKVNLGIYHNNTLLNTLYASRQRVTETEHRIRIFSAPTSFGIFSGYSSVKGKTIEYDEGEKQQRRISRNVVQKYLMINKNGEPIE